MSVEGVIRVGIIGAGLIGQVHSRMLRLIADRTEQSVRVVAVADVVPSAAQALASRWQDARAVALAEEIIGDPAIDAVWICMPTAMHREVCIAAARAGKHIFCEKPLAMTTAHASEMAAAIESAGVLAQVGLVMRLSPAYTVIKSMFADPCVGRMLAIMMRDDQDFPTRGVHASAWRNDPSLTAGGTLIEHSVHDFDILRWMFGPIARVSCVTRNLNGANGVEDSGAIEMEFAGGFHGQLTSVWHRMLGRPSNRRLEVFAENLFVASDYDTLGPIVFQRGESADLETIEPDEVMRRFSEILLDERPYLAPMKDCFAIPYAIENAIFVAALKGECIPDPPFAAGVSVQAMVESAYESARTRRTVEIEN
ncbi:MAG: Gfo/Idh/MocA family oxidoreductase [Candidatus Binatus sp.]|uniref:Gfo/Idh/MocA family protein n=1 Tax=Candidatus Binatus sp. TaxID=2811406 RepID=UPI00271CC23D|nr:Gfo/Idh/MocA family oxidoreductase [Candidatus Binatus sp.]MDO8433775.1 Gfo/Idh/MocA family oxidoreductase [Candidatus Binatus sp.]